MSFVDKIASGGFGNLTVTDCNEGMAAVKGVQDAIRTKMRPREVAELQTLKDLLKSGAVATMPAKRLRKALGLLEGYRQGMAAQKKALQPPA